MCKVHIYATLLVSNECIQSQYANLDIGLISMHVFQSIFIDGDHQNFAFWYSNGIWGLTCLNWSQFPHCFEYERNFCTNCGKRGTNIFNLYSAYICHEQFFSSRRKNSDWIEFDWALMCSEGPIADWICLTDLSYSIWIFRLRCFLCV